MTFIRFVLTGPDPIRSARNAAAMARRRGLKVSRRANTILLDAPDTLSGELERFARGRGLTIRATYAQEEE
jgi:hypothetical protein